MRLTDLKKSNPAANDRVIALDFTRNAQSCNWPEFRIEY